MAEPTTQPRVTTSVLKVVSALLADPSAERYGLDLVHETGLASGTLYPILLRLERAGWVATRWEDIDPVAEGRPSRRYYRLTQRGAAEARREIAMLRQHFARAAGEPPARAAVRRARHA
ncbi:MAG TPA: PadR family transcriptional regulator [Micromonosporaceae bacterium]|nr:PadR family transcriptional regulator [Micromonosporaceae bacterium]